MSQTQRGAGMSQTLRRAGGSLVMTIHKAFIEQNHLRLDVVDYIAMRMTPALNKYRSTAGGLFSAIVKQKDLGLV